jgi:RNA polymerase sigma-70 factor, ECF subfamily
LRSTNGQEGAVDVDDVEELYRLYSPRLLRYLIFLSGDKVLAEELLQETYYQAINSIFRFKGDSKVSTWLHSIAKNVYLKHLSKGRKEKLISIDEIDEPIASSLLEEDLLEQEQNKSLLNAINTLKEPYRKIVFLRSLDEFSFREIGDFYNQSENWARTNFYRAKLQVKEILDNHKGEA